MVWASPVCTRADDAQGDALVLSALEIIAHFDPLMWIVENPATGLLKTRPFMERLPWVDVTYCKYGTPYRKQTRLWTNMRWRPRRSLCRPGSRCEAWQDGRHLRAAQRGPRLMEGQYERVSQSRDEGLYQRRVQDDLGGQNSDVLDLKVGAQRGPRRVRPGVLGPQRSRGVRKLNFYHQVQLRRQQRRMPTMAGRSSTSA